MKKILVIGAGRSATTLIKYLIEHAPKEDWTVKVGDYNPDLAKEKVQDASNAEAFKFDINDEQEKEKEINDADLVISMLPARLHPEVAKGCVKAGKHLLTASYVTDEIKNLDQDATDKNIILLNECGLDPGIDHMSGMKVIDRLRQEGNELHGFETFTGGLLAPNTDVNPWDYKFTWNPRNVVIAGSEGVKFLQEGRFKYIPHHKIFRRIEMIYIPGYGYFEGYANRDSLRYRELYGLEEIRTMYRGTLRKPGFCKAWNIFVQLGATADYYEMEEVDKMTHRQFINSFLTYNPHDSIELKLAHYMNIDLEGDEMNKLKWSGFFDDELVGLDKGTPAEILEHILKKKWALKKTDRDMIVMWHKFNYLENGEKKEFHSTMVVEGDNILNTAMSKSVGLPLGIASKLILSGDITLKGVQIPTKKEIYGPVLDELKTFEFKFIDEEVEPQEG